MAQVSTFLEGMFGRGDAPSQVMLSIPTWDDSAQMAGPNEYLYGLMTSEYTLSTQNKWGTIISDVSNLSDISSLLGSESMWTWIGASVQCWKGTDPLRFTIEFYLINHKPDLNLETGLKALTKLSSLSDAGSKVKVAVHSGYQAHVLDSDGNNSYFQNSKWEDLKAAGNRFMEAGKKLLGGSGDEPGTVSIQIGKSITIKNLLVSRLEITPSTIEVMSQAGGSIKPLYYRVAVSFTGTKPLLSKDVDDIFG